MDKQMTIWLVIGVYAIFMLAIGILYSRKGSDMAGFTVGGRSAGAWISALSYGTAYFSAVMFIGYSGGSGWSYGLWSVLVGIGNAVFGSLLAWLVLANRTRKITRRHDIKSMPQLFEKRFQSPAMRLFSCIVIFVFLIPYSASVYKGLTSVCSVILGINEQVCMIIIAIASALLLVLGGYMATLKADFVQGFVMMIGVTALIVLVVLSPQVGGLSQGLSNMADYMKAHEMAPLPGKSAVALVSTLLMTSFGTWGLPQMVHKYYGIRDGKEVKRGTIISTFFALLVAGGRLFHRLFVPSVFRGNHSRGGQGFYRALDAGLCRAAQPAYRRDSGAADFRLCLHPFQHHPDCLHHCLHGFGEIHLCQKDGGQESGCPHPHFVPGLCGAQLCYRKLSHPHPGDDVLLLGDYLRLLPGTLPAVPVLEGY